MDDAWKQKTIESHKACIDKLMKEHDTDDVEIAMPKISVFRGNGYTRYRDYILLGTYEYGKVVYLLPHQQGWSMFIVLPPKDKDD